MGALIFIGGLLPYAITSFSLVVFNGLVTGFIIAQLWRLPNSFFWIMRIVPHGVLELIIYCLITTAALYMSEYVYSLIKKYILKWEVQLNINPTKKILRILSSSLVLLILAAVIEVYFI